MGVKRIGRSFVLGVMVLSLMLGVVWQRPVSAGDISTVSPNPASSYDQGNTSSTNITRHILIQSDHGDVFTVKLGLYYPAGASGDKTVTINGGAETACRFNTTHTGSTQVGAGRNIYRLYFNGYTEDSYMKEYSEACNSNNHLKTSDFTLRSATLAAAPVDNTTNNQYRRVTLTVSLVSGITGDNDVDGALNFSVVAPGAYVGLIDTLDSASSGPNNSFVAKHGYSNEGSVWVTQEVPFGLDCTEGMKTNAQIIMFDADNGLAPENHLYFYVQMKNAAGNWVTLPQGSSGNTIHDLRNVNLAANGTATPKAAWNNGNNAAVAISNMLPRTSYRMVIKDLYMGNHNYIYVGVPGDNIFGTGVINCRHEASAGVTISPDVDSYVEIGSDVSATGSINNTGTATANLQYNHAIWYEVGNQDNVYDAGVDSGLEQTGWTDASVAAGINTGVHTYNWNDISPPAGATYVCTSMDIRNQTNDDTDLLIARAVKCTPIGKAPSFAVAAGDVRTGGSYGTGACSVTKPASIVTDPARLSHFFGVIAHNYNSVDSVTPHHSYVHDAVLSVGYIENVVSKKGGIGGGGDTNLHFARGPGAVAPANTVLGGGQFYGDFVNMPTTFTTHCLAPLFAANQYPAATQTFAAGAGVTTLDLPAPSAGVTSVAYTVSCTSANNLLVLRGPGGGDLTIQPGQQYIVRVIQSSAVCASTPVFVRLDNNIRFSGQAQTVDTVPAFVLLAGTNNASRVNIHINNSVTRLDGIFANAGTSDTAATFLTCAARASSPPASRLTLRSIMTSDCSNKLVINGAVILGGRLNPYRAAGHSSVADKEPAELFNLRPDVVLGDYTRDRTGAQLEVVSQRELAPRF